MALRPVDKKVVSAFMDKQPLDGRILETDGRVLRTTGYVGGGSVVAKWLDDDYVSVLDEFSSRTEQAAARYVAKQVPANWLKHHGLSTKASTRVVPRMARKKKSAQQDRQPGQVSPTLRRRMGEALANIFDEFGPDIYSQVVLALKDVVLDKFREGFDGLDVTVKEELGRRGIEESRVHIRSWANEIVEDVNHTGLDEVAGALEDFVSTLTAEYQQPEEGDEILEVDDDEVEDVEEVAEEEVEPAEGEEGTDEELSLEDLGLEAPAEEAPAEETEEEAAASLLPSRRRRRRPNRFPRKATRVVQRRRRPTRFA